MIALKPPDKSSRLGFKYLRPTEGEETKPFKKEQPSQKRVRRSRSAEYCIRSSSMAALLYLLVGSLLLSQCRWY